jgi:hypothetical protein
MSDAPMSVAGPANRAVALAPQLTKPATPRTTRGESEF